MPPSHRPGDADDQAPPTAHLEAALRTVYAALPDDFMAVRKALVAQAKEAGDQQGATAIGRLRKPSTAAWAVNLLARQEPELVGELVALGVRMRTAQSTLDTATLTSLRPERDQVVAGVVAAAARVVAETGRTLSAAAQDDVRGTVVAALADEQASAAVTSGQLTRALSYSGFGEVDLSEAVVRTSSGSILSVVRGTGGGAASRTGRDGGPDEGDGADGEGAAAEGDAAERVAAAEAELEAAGSALSTAQDAVAAAREHAEETRERVGVVERQLAKAREADERALEAVTDAVRRRKEAEAARTAAEESLARLRAELDD